MMTTADRTPTMTVNRVPGMAWILRADAAISGAVGLLMLAGAGLLADLLDLPEALLRGAGIVLVPWVLLLAWLGTRETPPRGLLWAVVAGNLVWAAGCIVLLVGDRIDPNALGVAFIAVQIVAVLGFAAVQTRALRG